MSGEVGGAGGDGEGSGGFFFSSFRFGLVFGVGRGVCGLIEMAGVRFCCRLCKG